MTGDADVLFAVTQFSVHIKQKIVKCCKQFSDIILFSLIISNFGEMIIIKKMYIYQYNHWRMLRICTVNREMQAPAKMYCSVYYVNAVVIVLYQVTTRKKIPYEKSVKNLLKITRLLMKSGTNLYSIKFYNIL